LETDAAFETTAPPTPLTRTPFFPPFFTQNVQPTGAAVTPVDKMVMPVGKQINPVGK
jgi:hypothetical protein